MKRIIILAILLLSAAIASAQEGRNVYNKYSGGKGVSAVYISPSMFKIIGKLPDLEVETAEGESMNLAPLISSFKGFYMLDISDPATISAIDKDVASMISKGRYELMMEVKDEGETNIILHYANISLRDYPLSVLSNSSRMQNRMCFLLNPHSTSCHEGCLRIAPQLSACLSEAGKEEVRKVLKLRL